MNKPKSYLAEIFVIAVLMSFATIIYAPQIISRNFVVGDGALFYLMTEELQANHYTIPTYTDYNHDSIPYAYPPLGFYVTGFLSDVTGIETLQLFRLLPLVYTILTVPLLYLLSKELSESHIAGILSCVAFVAMAHSLMWRISGGGIVRGLAFLLAVLAIYLALKLFRTKNWRYAIPLGVASGFLTNTHLLITLTAVIAIFSLYMSYGWDKKSILHCSIVVAISGVFALPWLLTAVDRHGIEVVLGAYSQEQSSIADQLFRLLFWNRVEEPLLAIFGVISLLGFLQSISERRLALVIWIVGLSFIGHERGTMYIDLPMQLLFGYYGATYIVPGIIGKHIPPFKSMKFAALVLTFIVLMLNVYTTNYHTFNSEIHTLTTSERDAMAWARENTPETARFAIVTEDSEFTSEWFPLLADRHSLSTNQGYEWNEQWRLRVYLAFGLEDCASLECVETEITTVGMSNLVTHLFITDGRENCDCENMRQEIRYEVGYRLIYQNEDVSIFERHPDEIAAAR